MSSTDFVRSAGDAGLHDVPRRERPWLVFDWWLGSLLLILVGFGLLVLYSAVDQSSTRVTAQVTRLGLGIVIMLGAAQISPRTWRSWAPMLYVLGLALLLAVLLMGAVSNGSRRWLDLPGLPRFQPSELMKLALPLMIARYLGATTGSLSWLQLASAGVLIALPMGLIVVQPDLGTSLLIAVAGGWALLLAGLSWAFVLICGALAALAAPLAYSLLLHDYQQARVRTLFDPESDPLGAGWNIIQSMTAIGSGSVTGKGLFQGTQSHLDFLPERHTDFIVAVLAEEFGLLGVLALLGLYLLIVARGLHIAITASDHFGRLLAGSLTLTFFVYVFVNTAMVSGILPVVGVPLPLVSYGGTSAVTLLAGFGLLMSVRGHRRGW